MHNEAMKMAKHAMTDACAKGYDCMTSQDWDDLKDCVETAKNAIECDYYYRLVERMKKDEEEEKREDAYFLDMLKEEYKDDYKRMKDEYGEDEGERRFYDNYRYKSSGRFAPKGSGSYMPRSSGRRRGYVEPMYHMPIDMYRDYSAEELRDMDRIDGKMYYTPMSGGNSGNMSMGNSGEGSRGYSDGYNDGNRRGYEDGYRDGRSNNQRDGREGRSGQSRRTYMETKEMHKSNTPQDKQEKMKSLESYMKELSEDLTEMIEDASNEERSMLKAKLATLSQKIS